MAGDDRHPFRFLATSEGGADVGLGRHRRMYDYPEFDEGSGAALSRRKKRGGGEPGSSASSSAVAAFVGHQTAGSAIFGILFPKRSFPLDASNCTQVNPQSWVFDMNIFVGEAYDQVEEICIYLRSEWSIPPEKAVTCYVQSPGSQFQYRGAVYGQCPSAVLPLMWPRRRSAAVAAERAPAKIGISVEDLASLPIINMGAQRLIEDLALRIWEHLFSLVSNSAVIDGDRLSLPKNLVNQRFQQFKDRSKRDPDYLKNLLSSS